MFIVQAIITKYVGPTNTRGSRVKATASAGSITLAWDCSLNAERNHARAAEALANKFKWSGNWHQGGVPNDSGYAFVCVSDRELTPVFVTRGEH